MRYSIVAGRIVTAALLIWMGAIHLHLWNDGYRHIHDIGPLFLANFVSAVLAALAVLGAPRRLLPVAGLGAAGLALGTLAGLIVSVQAGLFGFRDSWSAPFAKESIGVEVAAAVVALGLSALGSKGRRRAPTPVPA